MLALSSLLWLKLGVWVVLLAIAGVTVIALLSVVRKRPN
jgi:hypothetical protein